MKIIDPEGRLFSRINLLDALVVVLICLALFWFGFKIVQRYTSVKEFDQYMITVRAPNLEETIARSIRKGDTITTPTGAYFGTIITEPEITPTSVYVTTPEGVLVSRTQPKLKDVVFVMQVRVSRGSLLIKYGNQTLKTGATGFIETTRTKYTILVLSIETIQETPEENPPPAEETSPQTP